jgi:parallel beta-helix repeat protein
MGRLTAVLRRALLLAAISAAALATAGAGSSSASDSACTRVAAPDGSDSAAGTEAAPFASAQKLVDSLGAGDVGCLRQGTYSENVTINHGGSDDASQVVVKSYAGERATISGRVYVTDNANYVTIEQLNLDGHDSPSCSSTPSCRLPSPTVNGDHITFQDNDVTNRHLGICFNLGNATYGRAVSDVIQRNRIHDCGVLPANNHEHGIYLSYADDTKILNNVIFDNADRGIQLYPDAQHTLIRGNVIDGNGVGVIFSGAGDSASNDNVVENNVISNSNIRHDVESWYPNVVGSGNVVRNNCIHGGQEGTISSGPGFDVGANLKVDPQFVDRAAKDFRLAAGSPCAVVLAGAPVPAAPDSRSGKQNPGAGDGKPDSSPAPQVSVSEAILHHSRRHGGRWRLRVLGHIRGMHGAHRGYVQIRRGGTWQRLGARRLRSFFRVNVDPRIPALHSARVTKVRIVVPGVGRSHSVSVRVRG